MGHLKKIMIHLIANIKHASVRSVASTTAIKKWMIWLRGAVQAYIQADKISRYVALKPVPKFNLPPDMRLQVLKYLYGLS